MLQLGGDDIVSPLRPTAAETAAALVPAAALGEQPPNAPQREEEDEEDGAEEVAQGSPVLPDQGLPVVGCEVVEGKVVEVEGGGLFGVVLGGVAEVLVISGEDCGEGEVGELVDGLHPGRVELCTRPPLRVGHVGEEEGNVWLGEGGGGVLHLSCFFFRLVVVEHSLLSEFETVTLGLLSQLEVELDEDELMRNGLPQGQGSERSFILFRQKKLCQQERQF